MALVFLAFTLDYSISLCMIKTQHILNPSLYLAGALSVGLAVYSAGGGGRAQRELGGRQVLVRALTVLPAPLNKEEDINQRKHLVILTYIRVWFDLNITHVQSVLQFNTVIQCTAH